jgi:hypothetical protein
LFNRCINIIFVWHSMTFYVKNEKHKISVYFWCHHAYWKAKSSWNRENHFILIGHSAFRLNTLGMTVTEQFKFINKSLIHPNLLVQWNLTEMIRFDHYVTSNTTVLLYIQIKSVITTVVNCLSRKIICSQNNIGILMYCCSLFYAN